MMRATFAILMTGLVFGGALSTISALADEEPQNFARGASLYSGNCNRCHNARGPGEYSDREWPLIITHMRMIAGLPGDQARAIEAFLRASNNPPALVARTRAPSRQSGEELIQRYGCRGCHRIASQGGSIGPSLAGIFDRREEAWIRNQILQPRAHNPRTVMPELGISDADARAIVEALRRMN